MAKNPYKVLSRPNTKKADIIRTVLPAASTVCHVYASCSTRAEAIELCRLLNLGLEVIEGIEGGKALITALKPKRKRKSRAR